MDQLTIQGGRPLRGMVPVSGAKNAALPILAATLAIPGPTCLRRMPELRDITSMRELLAQLGVKSTRVDSETLVCEPVATQSTVADYELVRKMRASVCVLGPLLASRGAARVSLPGGCNIGHRPIDLHLRGLAALGAEIRIENGYVVATAKRLRGAEVNLSGPHGSTVTGTCNVLTAAALASGTTRLTGAACEPEVVDLGRFLNACGARISGLGTSELVIDGVEQLQPCDYRIIPDRIEAATWLIAAVITQGELTVTQIDPLALSAVLELLEQTGAQLEMEADRIRISASAPPRPCDWRAVPYPGFPTDVQAQFTALMALAGGTSCVIDTVFPERFMHASELLRMGADVQRLPSGLLIRGVKRLSGAHVMASDLRASAALILAALAAQGESTIHRIYHLDRGYERLAEKLTAVGACVRREKETPADSRVLPAPHWNATAVPAASAVLNESRACEQ